MKKMLMEFIGTFYLVLAIGFTGNPLAIGLMLSVMVYAGGHISGAHYNPAVTLAFLVRRLMSVSEVIRYWCSQIAGAVAAAIVHFIVTEKSFAPAPAGDASFASALIIETLGTLALALVILNVATAEKLKGNFIYGFAIGLTVTACAFVGGAISGGAFNPAVGIGPALVNSLMADGVLTNIPLYIVGPCLGGFFAALVFSITNSE